MKKSWLGGVFVVAIAAAVPLAGCQGEVYDDGGVVEVEREPPPQRVEVVPVAPYYGAVWVGGRWVWRGNAHVWVGGRYVRPRAGYVYAPHRWYRRRPALALRARPLESALTRTAVLVACVALVHASAVRADEPFDREPWQHDLQRLEGFVSDTYPNFETGRVGAALDLRALDRDTEAALERARTDVEARAALAAFITRFRDPHLRLTSAGSASANPVPTIAPGTSARVACRAMGFDENPRDPAFRFPLPAELGFGSVRRQSNAFPWTTLALEHGRAALVRIASFRPESYPDKCLEAWARRAPGSACDAACQSQIVDAVVPDRLLEALTTVLAQLEAQHIDALVLDLTGNGGGSGWVGAVMRMLTRRPIVCGDFGFIRHPHWVKHFEVEARELRSALKSARPEVRGVLESRIARADANARAAAVHCDRSTIWRGEAPSCSLVVKQPSDCHAGPYANRPALYAGPLFVLVDAGTASASEDLVARYLDSHAATILGARTKGAGCGYTDGGITLTLHDGNSVVRGPDCARFLRSGTNEVEGLRPDVTLPVDLPEALAPALRAYLSSVVR